MVQTVRSPGRQFYDRQIALLQAGDVDTLIAERYHADAVLIAPQRVVAGAEALRTYFAGYLKELGPFTVDSIDAFQEATDAILFEATTTSNFGRVRVYDAFSLREGKIQHHFAGIIQRL